MDANKQFETYVADNIRRIGTDRDFIGLSNIWVRESIRHNYAQNFTWLGRPVIQVPQDVYAIQELIWRVKPDLIVETGIAHGGSLVLSASMLALLDYCDAVAAGQALDPLQSPRKVLGIDIDIRPHNRAAIDAHPLAHKIETLQGSSISPDIVATVKARAAQAQRILVFLDSNHTHDHVLAELEAYAPLTSEDSYCVVWDTGVEDLPEGFCRDRPWDKGNNPKTAVWEYLRLLRGEGRQAADGKVLNFEIDKTLEHKIAITASPDGFLRRVPA
ncbi:cephalosporin hydroxylase family protein [Methylomonas sp. UP202]|uniref:cephalosporin hydroxylase family protein n=1 Tax=Methylomonas sp. UP202 TaxID=3040943 RepID=UPI00247A3ED3|nr:cephalosporin hydroxylase family protein [Methylomonas sp. UP202]WGS86902.1 cephalosporin hydroxylase family protein [Methylomonas sp. UP202]